MLRRFLALATTLTCFLAVSLVALAGLPKKGGVYEGVIKSSPFQMRILLGVSPTGKKLQYFTYFCGTGSGKATVFGIPIDATGHFKWTKTTGTAVVWKMAGHFVNATKVFVSLNSIACGGSKGAATLTLKTT